jgi:hypothetical protein
MTIAVGTAKNNSSRTISGMMVSVNFYGDEDRLLDTVTAFCRGKSQWHPTPFSRVVTG